MTLFEVLEELRRLAATEMTRVDGRLVSREIGGIWVLWDERPVLRGRAVEVAIAILGGAVEGEAGT